MRECSTYFKSLFLFLIIVISFSPVSSADDDQISTTLQVSVLKYEPFPAEIGQYVSVWVKVDNFASDKSGGVSIEVVPEYPLFLDSPSNAIENIGILPPDNAAIHEYRLFVAEDAKPGVATIDIRYQGEKGSTWLEDTFNIRVGSDTFDSKGTIELGSIDAEPAVFIPGDLGTVTFTMRNSATNSILTIDGEDFDTNARIQSATLTGSDMVRVTSGPYEGDGIIGPGESIEITYNVEVVEDVGDGTYYLDLMMVGSSHSFNSNWRIPVKVDSSAVRVIPSRSLVLNNGMGSLEFDVANTHPNVLSSVSVKPEAEGVEFSPVEFFIGTMDPDELFTIEFDAEVISGDMDSPRNLTLSTRYSNGVNEHEEVVDVRTLRLLMVEEGNSTAIAVGSLVILAVAVAVFMMYRRRKQQE